MVCKGQSVKGGRHLVVFGVRSMSRGRRQSRIGEPSWEITIYRLHFSSLHEAHHIHREGRCREDIRFRGDCIQAIQARAPYPSDEHGFGPLPRRFLEYEPGHRDMQRVRELRRT